MASTFGALELDSIDTETEQLIQQCLKAIFQGRINFVIAHRLWDNGKSKKFPCGD
jgi:ABC-type transport system involved in cytochrome bd biosynthesis fused ATPase/permease subunit